MQIDIKAVALVNPSPEDRIDIGVAQVRAVTLDGASLREGAVGVVLTAKDGRAVHLLLTPDEAREVANALMPCAWAAAGATPPRINVAMLSPVGRLAQ